MRYRINATKAAIGWWATILGQEHTDLLYTFRFWRPTRDGACHAAERRCRRWAMKDARTGMNYDYDTPKEEL